VNSTIPCKVFLFTRPGCIYCDVLKMFLEAREIIFEERNIGLDDAARIALLETYHSSTTPTLVILTSTHAEVLEGFDPDRIDEIVSAA